MSQQLQQMPTPAYTNHNASRNKWKSEDKLTFSHIIPSKYLQADRDLTISRFGQLYDAEEDTLVDNF
uniref:Uncharacterized protein n=1 Tax=Glossina pallidipes TaxID=7398 RepID=A0A1B0AGI9_GLOPL